MDPDHTHTHTHTHTNSLLKEKCDTMSDTLIAHSSYGMDTDPLVTYFIHLGYFGVSQKTACPPNINRLSVLLILTGVAFCDIELLCVTREMCWVPRSSSIVGQL